MTGHELACSITDWIQAVGVIAGVVIAIYGLTTWRRQTHAQVRLDVARALRLRTRLLEDAIRGTLGMWGVLSMMRSGEREYEMVRSKMEQLVEGQVREPLAHFEMAMRDAEVLWPGTAEVACTPLVQTVNEYRGAVLIVFGTGLKAPPRAREEVLAKHQPQPGGSEFETRLARAIAGVEAFARPHLRLDR